MFSSKGNFRKVLNMICYQPVLALKFKTSTNCSILDVPLSLHHILIQTNPVNGSPDDGSILLLVQI